MGDCCGGGGCGDGGCGDDSCHGHDHGPQPQTNMPVMLHVDRISEEAKDVLTLLFKDRVPFYPGQFYMVWLPGVEQKPYSLSFHDEKGFGITVKKFGPFSQAIHKLKKGSLVGFSGPYGNGFTITPGALFVGGGVGMASISTAIDLTKDAKVIIGARSSEELVYKARYNDAIIMTDDGSAGKKGFVTVALEEELIKDRPPIVQACGPEAMLKGILEVCDRSNVKCELSVERYMSCGFGICGKCVMGDKMVCYDGPIFRGDELRENKDFGAFGRQKTGKKVPLNRL